MEVDILLEDWEGHLVGIEVKASASAQISDFKALAYLREQRPEQFLRGIVLYLGERTLPFADGMWAMPVDALWRLGARPQV